MVAEELKVIAESMLETARKNLEDSGTVLPVVLIGTKEYKGKKDARILAGLSWSTEKEKYQMIDSINRTFKGNVNFIVMVTEAWVSKVTPEEMKNDSVRPADQFNRQEAIVATARNGSGPDATFGLSQLFLRIKDGGETTYIFEPVEHSWEIGGTIQDNLWGPLFE
jgi:hypothetical protein